MKLRGLAFFALLVAVGAAQEEPAGALIEVKLARGGEIVVMKRKELAAYRLVTRREYLDLVWLVGTQRIARRLPGDAKGSVLVYGGRGAYPPSLEAIVRRLRGANISYRIAFGDDFSLDGCKLAIFPGGWAPSMVASLGEKATAALRRSDVSYLGICAGAYLACETVRWSGQDYAYPVGRAKGRAEGPLDDLAVFPRSAPVDLEVAGQEQPWSALYAGGSTFSVEGAKVRASYPGGRAAIISGRGWILSGAHIEFDAKEDAALLRAAGLPIAGDGKRFVALVRELLK